MARSKIVTTALHAFTNETSLAYAEIRLILARLFWRFDIEPADRTSKVDWILRQKTMLLWDKGTLMVQITPAREVRSQK